jgi:hypothetical protein
MPDNDLRERIERAYRVALQSGEHERVWMLEQALELEAEIRGLMRDLGEDAALSPILN